MYLVISMHAPLYRAYLTLTQFRKGCTTSVRWASRTLLFPHMKLQSHNSTPSLILLYLGADRPFAVGENGNHIGQVRSSIRREEHVTQRNNLHR